MAEQSLRLDGRKVCIIKRVGISQAESNNIKACALPSIHLPLTREARVIVHGKGTAKPTERSFKGKCGGAERGIVRFWEGWCGSKEIEIDRSANIKASEALTIPTVTALNSFRIVKVGLSEHCTASQKIISPLPPLFRGEARVIVHGKGTAKQAEHSLKGKGGGAERGIVRFWEGWCGERQ